jgi:hypothetical protein
VTLNGDPQSYDDQNGSPNNIGNVVVD